MSVVVHRHLRYTLPTGLTLAADAYGDPAAVPVLFFHGGGQTRHAWGGAAQAVARAVFTLRNDALEGAILDRMVLGAHRKTLHRRIEGRALRHRPAHQHAIVLKIMREGAEKCAKGDLAIVRQMAYELTVWLPHHVAAMDSGLSLHLKSLGYNTETGEMDKPEGLPATALTSCRSEPCEDHAA